MSEDIFLKYLPCIDLHGYDRESARVETEFFIKQNIIMKNKKVVIIHGIGSGIVKESVHNVLRKNKNVKEYKVDIYNDGCTVVELMFD